ncbi:LysR family transcriptional regulator [Thermomonospora cellulosilytica]|uniref:DNA-binding transcriptional LysR family regulator n=1 Tax=Thermomonospora cellulosilytica TaxID=1411118 RepID=A0A7W3MU63_9ACTN|nr:LysR family transcriptional regulator [Thermomonospora cellulosilytica]MBA9001929.1 DNA-binding transcriptional LysR family regulator [Thermomonospora cellulosilytica]
MSDRISNGPLDLALLRTFLAVYRAGSVTAGARLVGLSQPTATTQLKALEEHLGRRLFERLPRGVAPTPVADELAARLAAPMDALEAIAAGAPAHRPAPEPPVHLGGPAEALAVLVLPALAPLVERGVRLRITTGLADDLLAGLRAGTHDLVVSAIRPRGRALIAEPLMDEEFVLVAAPAWAGRLDRDRLAADGAAALAGVPLVSYAEDLPILRRYWRHVFGTRLTADPAIVVPDLRGVLAAVLAGAGVSVLPHYLCAAHLDAGTLVPLLEPDDPPINTAFLARRTGGPLHPHVALVHDHLLEAARSW